MAVNMVMWKVEVSDMTVIFNTIPYGHHIGYRTLNTS